MIVVEYTVQEVQATTQLIDMAVRARGLEVAGVAQLIVNKLQAAIQKAQNDSITNGTPSLIVDNEKAKDN